MVENEFELYYYDRKSDILNNRDLAVLRGYPNVTVSHHMAFYTDDCVETVVRDSLLGCQCCVQGKENPWEVKYLRNFMMILQYEGTRDQGWQMREFMH